MAGEERDVMVLSWRREGIFWDYWRIDLTPYNRGFSLFYRVESFLRCVKYFNTFRHILKTELFVWAYSERKQSA